MKIFFKLIEVLYNCELQWFYFRHKYVILPQWTMTHRRKTNGLEFQLEYTQHDKTETLWHLSERPDS